MNVISRPHFINETILSSQALDTLQIDLAQYSCELTFGVASPASCWLHRLAETFGKSVFTLLPFS